MTVIIGIDPHKTTHMAVAIDSDEHAIARLEVTADHAQMQRLLAWAAPLGEERTWAIESADGLGKLLSQQLLAAGEHVVDVPPTLAARVRLLGSQKAAKNDGNDAWSTAIAGRRHCGLRAVRVDDHATVLRLLVGRYEDLVSLRTQPPSLTGGAGGRFTGWNTQCVDFGPCVTAVSSALASVTPIPGWPRPASRHRALIRWACASRRC